MIRCCWLPAWERTSAMPSSNSDRNWVRAWETTWAAWSLAVSTTCWPAPIACSATPLASSLAVPATSLTDSAADV